MLPHQLTEEPTKTLYTLLKKQLSLKLKAEWRSALQIRSHSVITALYYGWCAGFAALRSRKLSGQALCENEHFNKRELSRCPNSCLISQ
jgi:hypothetical protein